MTDFSSFGLPENIVSSLARLGITTPTPIQAQSIPLALEGHDILGSAQTGTGKTLAYVTPLCVHLLANPTHHALVMAPTRELAMQVRDTIEKILGKHRQFEAALLIGGDPMGKQLAQLRRRPQLIIGTPGRINDHLDRGSLSLKESRFLVLDETDRMLDMGFSEQLESIIKEMHLERQTLMFSATMPSNMVRISKQYLKDAKRISVGSINTPVEHIKQDVIHTTKNDKFQHLLNELNTREGSVIVFVKTKMGCEQIKDKLREEDHSADAIHGDLHQRKREKVVRGFRANKSRIMVATDVAARGLDVPHVRHVINYDLPQCPEDYIHRIGRTGRAGAEGSALCLLSPDEKGKWRAIQQLMNPGNADVEFDSMRKGRGNSGSSRGRFSGERNFSDSRGGARGDRAGQAYSGERRRPASSSSFSKGPGERSDYRDSRPGSFQERSFSRNDRPSEGKRFFDETSGRSSSINRREDHFSSRSFSKGGSDRGNQSGQFTKNPKEPSAEGFSRAEMKFLQVDDVEGFAKSFKPQRKQLSGDFSRKKESFSTGRREATDRRESKRGDDRSFSKGRSSTFSKPSRPEGNAGKTFNRAPRDR